MQKKKMRKKIYNNDEFDNRVICDDFSFVKCEREREEDEDDEKKNFFFVKLILKICI